MDDCWFFAEESSPQALQEVWTEPAIIVSKAVAKTFMAVKVAAFSFVWVDVLVAECRRWLAPPAHAPPVMVV